MKKNISVELTRIIACLFVLGCHVYPERIVDGNCIFSRLYLACIVADGVAIFWLVMGYFLFNNSSYERLIKKTIKHIVIPMMLFSIFAFYCAGWIAGNMSLGDNLYHSRDEYINVLKMLCLWRNPVNGCDHLWYLYTYLLVILIFPVLKSFVQYLDEDVRRENCFLVISFGFLLLNDVSRNGMAQFSHYSINALVPAAIEVVWGHILYRRRECFSGVKCIFLSVSGFLLLNVMRAAIQWTRYIKVPGNEAILYWYSTIGLLCAICVAVFAFSIYKEGKRKYVDRIVYLMASCTFAIYIMQYISMDILQRFNLKKYFSDMVYTTLHGWFADSVYTIGYSLSVFMFSLIVILLIRGIRKELTVIMRYKWDNNHA